MIPRLETDRLICAILALADFEAYARHHGRRGCDPVPDIEPMSRAMRGAAWPP